MLARRAGMVGNSDTPLWNFARNSGLRNLETRLVDGGACGLHLARCTKFITRRSTVTL